ncbi:MAG: hypothetical protein GX558_02495 [Clostridiales bacterium]|nr:hypothetical protein [Clostridiales bacterium]
MGFPRVEALRGRFLARAKVGSTSDEMRYLFARGWLEHRAQHITARRYTLARARVYAGQTPTIGDGELIVGRPNHDVALTDEQAAFLALAEGMLPGRAGQDSHMAIDYEKLLALGTDGVRRQILDYQSALDEAADPRDIAKWVFYGDCLTMLEAVEGLAARYADHAEAMAAAAEPGRAAELTAIAANLRIVPKYPARTFWQALQSVHFVTFGLQGLYQMGRPDQYLLPYYRRDVESGALTPEFAQELIDCFCLLYNEYTAKGLAVGLMVGGRYPDGTDVDNELTEMFLQSIFDVRLSYPGVGLCVTPRTSDRLLRLACRALAEGHSHPALFNDEVIAAGLMRYGLPFDEAVSYIHSTCVEITPIKRSAVWVASPYYNLMEPLLDLLNDGAADGAANLEELIGLYQAALSEVVREGVRKQNELQMERDGWYTHPLVSCFVDDCLARGRDLDHGGAKYHFIESSFVGMANLVDSLLAIDQMVFSERKLTMAQFAGVLRRDFDGDEPLRQYILNKCPQYGNDDARADALFGRMAGWVADELEKYRTWRGSRFIPSMFCWVMHAELGKRTQATPDGRKAGFPLGDGSGPAQGRERNGPTASVLSSTSWPHERFIGGIAVNMKFSKALMSGEAIDKMVALVRAFMARGGFELQINAVDRQKLLEAQKNPDQYRDLVVRIGGYSDYFTNLSPEMQREVLLRTEHEL